jgi:plasmid stability protein
MRGLVVNMWRACYHACNMPKMIQIRDVPDQVHSILKARAAREGMSLSDLIKRELEQTAERPSMQEWLDRTREARPIKTKLTGAQAVREVRDSE